MDTDQLDKAIKYVFWDREDWYPKLVGPTMHPQDRDSHLIYADWVADHGDHELGERIRKAVADDRLPYLGGSKNEDLIDRLLEDVRAHHRSPTVRALAQEPKNSPYPFHPDLIDILFHSKHLHDRDLAVNLAPEDPTHEHPYQTDALRDTSYLEAGLRPKVVRGHVYLLDYTKPDRNAFEAPHIVAKAPVGDAKEVSALHHEANRIRDSRSMVIDGAHVSEPEFATPAAYALCRAFRSKPAGT